MVQNGALEELENNIIEGNDLFDDGRNIQYQMQRLDNTDRHLEGDSQIQDESLMSSVSTMEDQ